MTPLWRPSDPPGRHALTRHSFGFVHAQRRPRFVHAGLICICPAGYTRHAHGQARARGTPEHATSPSPSYVVSGKKKENPWGIQIKKDKWAGIMKGNTQREMAVDVADP